MKIEEIRPIIRVTARDYDFSSRSDDNEPKIHYKKKMSTPIINETRNRLVCKLYNPND